VLSDRIALEPHARARLVHDNDWPGAGDVRWLEEPATNEPRIQDVEVVRRNDSLFNVGGTIRESGIRESDASVRPALNGKIAGQRHGSRPKVARKALGEAVEKPVLRRICVITR